MTLVLVHGGINKSRASCPAAMVLGICGDTLSQLHTCTSSTASTSIILYYIVSIHLYSASYSAHQSEALPVRETQRLNCRSSAGENRLV